jgi:hypothetical protein
MELGITTAMPEVWIVNFGARMKYAAAGIRMMKAGGRE